MYGAKNTPPTLWKELKKITVWIVCNPTMGVQKIIRVNKITNLCHY